METANIENFFSSLKATIDCTERFQKANSLEYAFEFNPLIEFFDIKENKLSKMLAYFLDPYQKHGQGDVFLKSFIELDLFNNEDFSLIGKIGTFKKVVINLEKQTIDQRRLDILIDFDGQQFGIGIENKIWAKDQNKQLDDYNKWLGNKYKGNYILVYLTPYGHIPSNESIQNDKFVELLINKKIFILDYSRQFLRLLKNWEQKSQAENVRIFFKDFQKLFIHTFKGNIFMNQQKTISDFIIEKPEFISVAFGVSESLEEVKEKLLLMLFKQAGEIAKELQLEVGKDKDFYEYKGGINFKHLALTNIHLRIKFGIEGNNWVYGIVQSDAVKHPNSEGAKYINEYRDRYQGNVNFHSHNNAWFASENLFENAKPADVFLKIGTGKMRDILRDKLILLLDAFNKLDPEKFHFVIPENSKK